MNTVDYIAEQKIRSYDVVWDEVPNLEKMAKKWASKACLVVVSLMGRGKGGGRLSPLPSLPLGSLRSPIFLAFFPQLGSLVPGYYDAT